MHFSDHCNVINILYRLPIISMDELCTRVRGTDGPLDILLLDGLSIPAPCWIYVFQF